MTGKQTAASARRAARQGTKLALAAAATASAASQTVALRSMLLARALGDPMAMADPEFSRMATEKMTAAALSGVALAAHAPSLWLHWLNSAASPWAFAGAAARAGSATLAPYHQATRANAKRLSRRRASK
jgi:hypothetical protein